MKLIDGKAESLKIKEQLKHNLHQADFTAHLVIVSVGDDPASAVYMRNKVRFAEYVGMDYTEAHYDSSITEQELTQKILEFSNDDEVDGIIVQLPLPEHLNEEHITHLIPPAKDVDGFTSYNLGKLVIDDPNAHIPCTPAGVIHLMKTVHDDFHGLNVVIVGRSTIVGKPLAIALTNLGATVTICNSKTRNLKRHTQYADVIITAAGQPNLLHRDHVKNDATVIDVGINRLANGKLVGDVDFESFKDEFFTGHITPVPGGVGPMTVAYLINNTYKAAKLKNQ